MLLGVVGIARAQSPLEELRCSSVTTTLSKAINESDWTNPDATILGIRTENWTSTDFAAAADMTASCRQRACLGSQDTCALWDETIVPPIMQVIESAPGWIESSRQARATAAVEAAAARAAADAELERQQQAEQRSDAATATYRDLLQQIAALPDTAQSLSQLDSIQLIATSVETELPPGELDNLTNQFASAYSSKRGAIEVYLEEQQCSVRIVDTLLPLSIYQNPIFGTTDGVITYDETFENFVCALLANGYSVEYENLGWWEFHDHRLVVGSGDVVTELLFSEHSSDDAWILSAIETDGDTDSLTEEESIQLLTSLVQR